MSGRTAYSERVSWSAHVPAGPCETFADRAKTAVGELHLEQRPGGGEAEIAQATKAIELAGQIVADVLHGTTQSHYSANLSGHVGGDESFGVHVSVTHAAGATA